MINKFCRLSYEIVKTRLFSYLRRCSRACQKVLQIRAETVFETWQEVTLSDLIFTIYLWGHGLRVVDVQGITNISKRNLIKVSKDSANVAASSYSEIL